MRRQGQYADAGVNPLVSSQMQQHQRMQHNPVINHFPGRQDALSGEEETKYMISKAEGQWQWDRDGPRGSNQLPSHPYKEGHGSDVPRSLYQGPRPESKVSIEKQSSKDPRGQPHEKDMEHGYEENTMPQTFEGLENKFHNEIMKLIKELQEAEDAEIARHREKINEINDQYLEKLMTVRARQVTHRDDFLRRESQARQHQYQQAALSHYPTNSMIPTDPHGYGAASAVGSFAPGHLDSSYKERSQFPMGGRNPMFDSRGSYPGGRTYDSGSRYY
ncbi:hypothetical protein H6P81_016597 [Aristolochia fimbriata]|uniref:Uncharacterized protein n=1 Tax=Aristolochia fimbriata TaxID=158543 RepID=A0AAV7ECK1_ARIFI|nr:hypothetical protein H6P81_016597 [Aristolochia fimbriata]